MKSLSWWAHTHPRMARWAIVTGHMLLVWLAISLGRLWQDTGWTIPLYFLFILTWLFITILLLYPSRNQRKNAGEKWGYRWQKICDMGILLTGFLMVAWVVAHPEGTNSLRTPLWGAISLSPQKEKPTAREILSSLQYRDKNSLTRQEKRILRKELKHQLKVYAKATLHQDPETRDRAGLIILTIIGAIGLTLLLAALVCSISCGGAEGLAILVGILGMAGILVLTFVIIRSIRKGPRKRMPGPAVADIK